MFTCGHTEHHNATINIYCEMIPANGQTKGNRWSPYSKPAAIVVDTRSLLNLYSSSLSVEILCNKLMAATIISNETGHQSETYTDSKSFRDAHTNGQ